MFLEAHFGEIELHMPDDDMGQDSGEQPDDGPAFLISLDEAEARISLLTMASIFHSWEIS
jgi:cleavage and polyadenylation specificity factor subunit 3